MQTRQIKISHIPVACLILILTISSTLADEKIIKQEKISFEKCLNVITTSEDKLSISPVITNVEVPRKRVAVFTLIDGNLTIICDGEKGNVTVSTSTN